MLKTVVLPAPFGPISAVIVFGSTENEQSVDGADAAEDFGQVTDFEKRHEGPSRSS